MGIQVAPNSSELVQQFRVAATVPLAEIMTYMYVL